MNAKFEATNSLEHDLSNILTQYGYEESNQKKKEEQQLESRQLTREEIRAKQAELAKMRSLMFFAEKKAKRIKKIKSKSYRKKKKDNK